MTFLLENFASDQSFLIASATDSSSATSPSRTAPGGSATCPNRWRVASPLPNDSSAARTPEVPMSRPTALRAATAGSPAFLGAADNQPAAIDRSDGPCQRRASDAIGGGLSGKPNEMYAEGPRAPRAVRVTAIRGGSALNRRSWLSCQRGTGTSARWR